jgi:hydrogenase nickel incorporation protein HypA/HybF
VHELSVALQIRTVLEEELMTDDGPLVAESVRVQVGALANVVPEALQFAWPHAVSGSRSLDGSRIEIDWVDATLRCGDCAASHTTATLVTLRCPACRSADVEVIGGDELDIVGVDVREPVGGSP